MNHVQNLCTMNHTFHSDLLLNREVTKRAVCSQTNCSLEDRSYRSVARQTGRASLATAVSATINQ